jgi:hypothetical protein
VWSLFDRLFRNRDEPSEFEPEALADLDGRHLHYLSARKIRTLAAEHGVEEEVSHTVGHTLGPSAANVKDETTASQNRDWPVQLAAEVTRELIRRDRVAALPDLTQRYFAGRLYMLGGTLGALDLTPPAAWFMGAGSATAVMLCGSAGHLRDRPSEGTNPTWYPSRLDELSLVVRSIARSDEEDDHLGRPEYLTQPGSSHVATIRSLLSVIKPETQRGATFMLEWADFVAVRHFAIPAFELGVGTGFTQVVLGSPLWVASHEGPPPAGWYPDPGLDEIPGTARYWDGRRWTELCYTNGTQLSKPPPEGQTPVGWMPFWARGRFDTFAAGDE